MFKAIKTWLGAETEEIATKEKRSSLRELGAGSAVHFSITAGALVSRVAPYPVAAINCYQFGDERFTSYALTGPDGKRLGMILMDEGDEDENPYFSLSQQLTDDQMRMIAGEKNLKLFLSGTFPSQINAQENGIHGWISASYSRILSNEDGSFLDSDSRTGGKAFQGLMVQPFQYTLYVDDARERALEIEQYTDGRTKFYATAYLPIGGIAEITDFIPPPFPPVPILPQEEISVLKAEPEPEAEERVIPPLPVAGYEVIAHENVEVAAFTHVAPARAMNGDPEQVLLEMEAPVAARLIEEAGRNDISLAELVRKVTDLPRRSRDWVMIPIEMHEEDYVALGKKYDIDPDRRDDIRQKLKDELAQFAGYESNGVK